MKKILFLLSLLILASCNQSTPTPIPTDATATYELQVKAYETNTANAYKAFEVSQRCPKICWLGIQPDTTTTEDARDLLVASDYIQSSKLHITESEIQTTWFTHKTFGPNVSLTFENGFVKSIYFVKLVGFKVDDFIHLLGEPDEISIHQDEGMPFIYTLYFTSLKTDIYVLTKVGATGPGPNDFIDILSINVNFNDENLPSWRADDYDNRQRWLGYGHLDEYLPERSIPLTP